MFLPEILEPTPDPWFVHELKLIDPSLRVVFGYTRYLKRCWAIERRMTPERYYACYKTLIEAGEPRFVDQPVYDTAQPVVDEHGEHVGGYAQVGSRRYDLAPDWEWLQFADVLDGRALLELRRAYAWNRNHPLSRARYEQQQREADEAKERDKKRRDQEALLEGCDEAWFDAGKFVSTSG